MTEEEVVAIACPLVGSCDAAGINPRERLEDVLLRIPENSSDQDAIRELLPDRWTKKTN